MTTGSEYPTDSSASGPAPSGPAAQGYSAQPYPQQPYPQQPYNQQAGWGQHSNDQQPYAQPAWGQHGDAQPGGRPGYQPRPTSDNPYQITPAQYYRDQGYAEPEPVQPYPTQYRSAAPAYRAQRSSVLGGVSFGLVAAMLAICVAAAQSLGQGYKAILLAAGTLDIEAADVSEEMVAPLVFPGTAIGMASLVGIIGLIIGIVAAVSRRGRGWGVAAIITGLVAPVIWSTVFMMVLLPVVESLS
jgi:hypothetical protein